MVGLLLSALLPCLARADGVMISYEPSRPADIVAQRSQQAWIQVDDGIEKLTLAVQTRAIAPRLAWIVPIPAPARLVSIDLVEKAPEWGGEEIRAKARRALVKYWIIAAFAGVCLLFCGATQWLVVIGVIAVLGAIAIPNFGGGPGSTKALDVTTYSHVELGGLVSELVDTPSAKALEDYLKAKSCLLPKPVADRLPAVLDGKTSLIVSWASHDTLSKSLALEATFPSETPFYPMKLTSAYGESRLTVDLRVKGWHEPPEELRGLESLRWGYYPDCTRVLFRGKAEALSGDWTLSPRRLPVDLWLALGTANLPILANLILLALSGVAAAFLVSWAGQTRQSPDRLVRLGASMVLPYYGPAALLRRWGAEEEPPPGFYVLHLACLTFLLLFNHGLFKLWPVDRATVMVSAGGDTGLMRKSNEGATRGNLGTIRSALSIYYGDMEGQYPADPYALTKDHKYLPGIPPVKLPPYHADSNAIELLTAGDSDDSGGWGYVVDGSSQGVVFVNCTHTDSRQKIWAEY
ncbi:MAG: DUF2330 domain-containing protein [Elusimicrobiota bacterium]